jgi:probable DNA repair protein
LTAAAAAGRTILTPNAELAAAVFDALEREERAAGHSVWRTPKVRDYSSWLKERQLDAHLADARLLRPLSDLEERELWHQVIEASLFSQSLLDVSVAARAARRARRTLQQYGISFDELVRGANDETKMFLEWNREFDSRLRSMGCAAGEAAPPKLAAGLRLSFIDSEQWRPAARQWLRRHAEALSPQRLVGLGEVFSAESPGRELAAMAEWARSQLAQHEEFRAWICIPSLAARRAEVQGAFDAQLAPDRFALRADPLPAPYGLAGGEPLAQVATVRVALALLRAGAAPMEFRDFSAMLRESALHESAAEAGEAARLDVLLRERGPNRASLGRWLTVCESLQHSGCPLPGLARLRRAFRTLDEASGARRFSDWVPRWLQACNDSVWFFRARWSDLEYQAAQQLRDLFAQLAASDAFFGTQSRDAAAHLLWRAARETTFQARGALPSVWISGQLQDPWLTYSALWVAERSEEAWPPPPQPVPLLPLAIQRRHGVVGAHADTQLAAAKALQHAWAQRAPRCVFSLADPPDGRGAVASRLLPNNSRHLEGGERPHWVMSAVVLESHLDDQGPAVAENESTHGVSTLLRQSRCPFLGFADQRLGAKRLEMPVPGFNDMQRGLLVHAALERVWNELGDSNALAALDAGREQALLMRAIEAALEEQCRRRDPGTRWRERERIRLLGLLTKWLRVERLRPAFRVRRVEGANQPVNLAGLEYRLRIDRLDELEDGARVLIDYKTGGKPRPDWRGERPDNPQLPLQALLQPDDLVAVAYGHVSVDDPRFIAEAALAAVFGSGNRTRLEGEPDFPHLIERWRGRLERIATEYAQGEAAVAPTESACRRCVLQGLCRVPTKFEDLEDE